MIWRLHGQCASVRPVGVGVGVVGAVGGGDDDVHPLALGAAVLEPELDVLLLQAGELLAVGQAIQLIRVSTSIKDS